jgi:hypothetical protein
MSVEKTPSSPVPSKSILACLVLCAVTSTLAFARPALAFPAIAQKDTNVATASSTSDPHAFTLGNRTLEAKWDISSGRLTNLTVTDRLHHKTIAVPSAFSLLFADGNILRAQDLHFVGTPAIHDLKATPGASRYSDQLGGREFEGTLEDAAGDLRIDYGLVLRDGSAYLRQILTISAPQRDLPIKDVRLIDLRLPGVQVAGTVAGSPLVAGNLFFGVEHPLSISRVSGDNVVADLERTLPLSKGQSITYSSVIGVTPTGQVRRAFLTYIERERAHPYRTFLHYNSWYDAGYFTPYDEALTLDRVNTFGRELHDKRAVTLDSFLFDDGWDNHSSLWGFNQGFPNGFTPIRDAAARYGAAPGIWMSPWGGYSKPKQERIAYGRKEGFEIVDNGYALSGPRYYEHFHDVCLDMIRRYGINQFKFDGTGNANHVVPGSHFDSDFSAMIHLIGELRQEKPDIYINLTTGTAPSPFWLLYADSIWRGGEDDSFAGVGTNRERWITYRDADTYAHVVSRGPLYPLNSLMLHGIIYAQYNPRLDTDPGDDFANEVHSYFGTGTQLQEMYITPSLLSQKSWDTLAETAKWSRENASVLADTHWVGGDPNWLEVYGWASWSPKKGILVLRNPSDKPGAIAIDLAKVLELPPGAPLLYTAKSPWKSNAQSPPLTLNAHSPHKFTLAPFEVVTLDLQPK